MLFFFDFLSVLHNLALDYALNAEAGSKRPSALPHRKIGVVKDATSRMSEFRCSPAWPRQAVIVTTNLGIVLRRAHRNQIELCLISHMGLETLGRLAAVSGRP